MDLDGTFYCSKCMQRMEIDGLCPHCGFDNQSACNSAPALEIYTLLHGRYQLGAVVGSGGFGLTYAAWDETLWIPVAIKEYLPIQWAVRESGQTDEVSVLLEFEKDYLLGRERFLRESRVLAMLQDIPGVVKVYDCFEENNTAYIIMEYMRGVTIDHYVKEHHTPPETFLQMLRQPIDALVAIHRQGVLHRDITPNNLLVQEDGSVKLIDFGSAAQTGQALHTIVLTRHYAPPEQYSAKNGQLGPWTDVYGLSATLYSMLTGEAPQEATSRRDHDELDFSTKRLQVRRYQRGAIKNGLVLQPSKRTQSMEEFRAALYHLPMPEEVRRRKRFARWMAGIGAALGIGAAAVLANFTCGLPLGQGLLYSIRTDGLHIVSELGAQAERALPGSWFGLPVCAVDESAFSGDEALRALTVPGTISEIGSMAFFRCSALERVELEDGVRWLGDYAFAECEKLHTVSAPESLGVFPVNAFERTSPQMTFWGRHDSSAEQLLRGTGINFAVREDYEIEPGTGGAVLTICQSPETNLVLPSVIDGQWIIALADTLVIPETVADLTLPDRVYRLDGGILSQREALKKVTLGGKTRILGDGALKNSHIEELVIPGYLEEIGAEALRGVYLRDLTLPAGLQTVGSHAFSESFLSTAALPDGVVALGSAAFSACVNMVELHLPEGIPELSAGLFENCIRLERVYIPSTASAIRMYAFRGCRAMKSILIPETVDEIDAFAFSECTGLRYVAMPQTLEAANLYMFDGCSNSMVLSGNGNHAAMKLAELKGYSFEDESAWNEMAVAGVNGTNTFTLGDIDGPSLTFPSYDRASQTIVTDVWRVSQSPDNTILTLNLPRYSTSVAAGAMTNLTELTSVDFPDTMRTIGQIAFGGCVNLRQADLPEGLELIDSAAFLNCRRLSNLTIPDSVNYISECAFFGCKDIGQIRISENLSLLPDGVFGRTGISQITVLGNISKVRCAFFECSELRSAELQEGVRSLWESFAGCTALETVTLPESLELVSGNTFGGCTSLKDVFFYANSFAINERPFVSSIDTCAENPDGSLDTGLIQSIPLPHGGAALEHLFADSPDVTIHAYRGSMMEQYAADHNLHFQALDDSGPDMFA